MSWTQQPLPVSGSMGNRCESLTKTHRPHDKAHCQTFIVWRCGFPMGHEGPHGAPVAVGWGRWQPIPVRANVEPRKCYEPRMKDRCPSVGHEPPVHW